ncbi:MAG TPA: ATP-binding protein [Stellaceae bacterium]|nr:ATP-binding protein [Stellaceae bacterium]
MASLVDHSGKVSRFAMSAAAVIPATSVIPVGAVPVGAVPGDAAASRPPSGLWLALLARTRAAFGGRQPPPGGEHPFMDRAITRYGAAFVFVTIAAAVGFLIEGLTGRFSTFPFYVAVVASVWFGSGAGCFAVILSIIVVEDIWTPPLFSFRIEVDELPSFVAFVLCTLMTFGWSSQRRRAHHALETTVQQRTADLRRINAALQVEIAERQAAEEELRRSEALLAQGQKLSRTASWRLQLPAGDMQWSAQLFDLLGIEHQSEPDGSAPSYELFTERLHRADRARFEDAVTHAIEDRDDFSCEARIVTPDGTTKHVQAVGEVKRGAGDAVEFIGTVIDLTERKRTEQALQDAQAGLARTLRLATLAELAAAIAHEINQPLAAITANGSACLRSLMRDPPMLENARDAADCIVTDGHRAGDVIARIRALFNKESPKQRPVDVNGVVGRVLDLLRGTIDRERVVVSTKFAAAPRVMGDPVQLEQVVVNLVTNAVEAMADVTGRTRSLTVKSAVDGDQVIVTVEDAGSGLDAAQVPQLFESFYTTKKDGIGVGLAISRSIIEAHGGSLWAVPGTIYGAKFGFTLCAATGSDGAPDLRGSPEVSVNLYNRE